MCVPHMFGRTSKATSKHEATFNSQQEAATRQANQKQAAGSRQQAAGPVPKKRV